MVKGDGIYEKAKHTTSLASFMTKQSLLQSGVAVGHHLALSGTPNSTSDGPGAPCAHFVNLEESWW